MKDSIQSIVKQINALSGKHNPRVIFDDLIAMYAIAIANGCDWAYKRRREKMYMEIVSKHDEKTVYGIQTILIELVDYMNRRRWNFPDIFGAVFQEMGVSSKLAGQFFTPASAAEIMGNLTIRKGSCDGVMQLYDPACGSGALLLGYIRAAYQNGVNVQRNIIVYASDLDIRSVYMSYIQLSLYGIPALITRGDSLAMSYDSDHWRTPLYIFDNWSFSEKARRVFDGREEKL